MIGVETPICPTCGCSLVRLHHTRDTSPTVVHRGAEYYFCCEGCITTFKEDPDRFVDKIRDVVVCPSCLAEKHVSETVALEFEGAVVRLCRCPYCVEAFKQNPERMVQRLAF